MGCSGIRPKGLEDLNVYRDSRNTMQRSDRTFICSGCCDACEGQALALQAPGRFFFVVRESVRRDRSLILATLTILAILLQTRDNY